jgi:hypothetical protein
MLKPDDPTNTAHNVQVDRKLEGVVFIRAKELLDKMGLYWRPKPMAIWAARDEWLAVKWIPADMVVQAHL